MQSKSPSSDHEPNERVTEIAEIFAAGFLRRQKLSRKCGHTTKCENSSATCLESRALTRLTVPTG